MKNTTLKTLKFFLLISFVLSLGACIKNDNFIKGDAKVRIFNSVVSDTTRNFYFNQALYNSQPSIAALASATNTSYFVVEGEKEYLIDSRNSITGVTNGSITQTFDLGKNYSIYYTKEDNQATTKPKMLILQDLVRQDTSKAQVMFINMGYTLASEVIIKSRDNSYTTSLGYGKKSEYVPISILKPSSTLLFNLKDSVGVVDSISYSNFNKGRVYTIILEGTAGGKLKERLVPNN